MGAPKFYFYPVAGGLLKTIDFSALCDDVTDFDDDPLVETSGAISQTGRDYTVVGRTAPRLRLYFRKLRRYSSAGALVERQLRGFIDHLKRGGVCAVALDQDKAWASFAVGPVEQNDGSAQTQGDLFGGAFETNPLPASGDEVWIQGAYPERRRELLAVSGYASAGNTVSFGSAVSIDAAAPALLHTRDFWPVMVLPQDQRGRKLLTVERGRHFTLDMTLEMDTGRIDTLGNGAGTGSVWGDVTSSADLDLETIGGQTTAGQGGHL